MTGGFPLSDAMPLMLIPIVLTYCTFGSRVSYMATFGLIVFAFSQVCMAHFVDFTFPDLASESAAGLNQLLVQTTTFTIVIIALISLDVSTQKYIQRADMAAQK